MCQHHEDVNQSATGSTCFAHCPAIWRRATRRTSLAYPFFSLAESKRITPIDFRAGTSAIFVSKPC
jgi:hypothetical protein